MRRCFPSIVLLAALLAGCGSRQVRPPDLTTPAAPAGSIPLSFDRQGVRLAGPGGWRVQTGAAPLVATIQSGTATVAVWRYPRTEPLPAKRTALRQAQALLLAAARARDPSFTKRRATIAKVDGHPAITILGSETVAGQARTVRSTHVYALGSEVVIDAIAPAGVFGRVDRGVVGPLVRSLHVRAPISSS